MQLQFRNLEAEEIEVRIAQVRENEVILLLYKDARVDMNVLDETVNPFNWKREHTRDNKNCIVSIWDDEKKQWISKEDTGKESYAEAEKGLASDSFKRACFNWGIGRELYTAPTIKIKAPDVEIRNKKTYNTFKVTKIKCVNKVITELEIINCQTLKIVFKYKKEDKDKKINTNELRDKIKLYDISLIKILAKYNVENLSDMTIEQYKHCEKLINEYYVNNKKKEKEAV